VHGQQSSFLRIQTSSAVNITNKRVDSTSSTFTETEMRELFYIPKPKIPKVVHNVDLETVIDTAANDETNEEFPLWEKLVVVLVVACGFVGIISCCKRYVRKCNEE
jgi:hypothetical protein